MREITRGLVVAIFAIFLTISETPALDVTVLSGSSSSIVNGMRDTTPVVGPRDTVMVLGGSRVEADYVYENTTNIFRFGFNQELSFKGGDIAISNDGTFEFRITEPAIYEFAGSNSWNGTTVDTGFQNVTMALRTGPASSQTIYSESDSVRASRGGIALQEIGEGQPITVNSGKRRGVLEPGTYNVWYAFGLLDDAMDHINDPVMQGHFGFTLVPVSETQIRPLLQEGVDYPVSGTFGAKPWMKTTITTRDNVDAARSGTIGYGEESTVRIGVPGAGILSFWWKVSSQTNADFLTYSMDGHEMLRISGEVGWQQRRIMLPPNIHELDFTYRKDTSAGGIDEDGQDAAWLDQVTFEPIFDFPGPRYTQNIRFDVPNAVQPFTEPVALDATANSFLPVSYTVVIGPAIIQGNNLIPTGNGTVRVRAEQPGDMVLFLPATPVERTFTVNAPAPHPLAANLPQMSVLVGGGLLKRTVRTMAVQPDGKLIIGGYFDYVNGYRRWNIARFHKDGTLDHSWVPKIDNLGPYEMAIHGDAVFVVGSMNNVNELKRDWLAKISLSDGSVDPLWNPVATATPLFIEAAGDMLVLGGGQVGGLTRGPLAKISPSGEGIVDPLWNPIQEHHLQAMAVAGPNVYASVSPPTGGLPTALMKLSLEGTGAVDTGWRTPFQEVESFAIAANERYLVVAGSFRSNETRLNGIAIFSAADGSLTHLARTDDYAFSIAIQGNAVYAGTRSSGGRHWGKTEILKLSLDTFEWDTNWTARTTVRNDGIIPTYVPEDLAFRGADLFVAGDFDSIGGSPGSGVALLPVIEAAPVVTPGITTPGQQTTTGLRVTPHPADELETTHFLITQVAGGTVYQADGITPIASGEFITRAEGAAGLRFTPLPGFVGNASFRVLGSRSASLDGLGTEIATATVTVLSGKLDQSITSDPIPNTPLSRRFVELRYSTSSGLPVTFTVTGPAFVNGNILTLTGVGEVRIFARQEGNEAYNPSLRVVQIFNVLKGEQTITFVAPPSVRIGELAALVAEASSGLPVTFEVVSGPGRLVGGSLLATNVGPVVVRAQQAGNELYNAAPPVDRTVTVEPRTQTITFLPLGPVPFNGAGISLGATASSGLPVSYTVISGPATLAENLLRATGAGQVVVEAVQAGNAEYASARAQQTFTFAKAVQEITFEHLPFPLTMTSLPVVLRGTASSGLPVRFTTDATNVTISGNVMTILAPGRGFVYVQQPGDANYEPSLNYALGFDIPKLEQVITNDTEVRVSLNAGLIPLRGRASSGLPVSFRHVSGPGTVVSNNLVLHGTGYIRVEMNQAGNHIYFPANPLSVDIYVDPGNQTVQFQPLTNVIVGRSYPLVATASSGLPVTFSVRSGPARLSSTNTLQVTGAGTIVVAAWQNGNTNWNRSPDVLMTIESRILKSPQTITFPPIPEVRYSDREVQLYATASSGLPIEYAVQFGRGIIAGTNRVSFLGVGQITVLAWQPGNEFYHDAPHSTRTFNVLKGGQSINFPQLLPVRYKSGPVTLRATASSGLPVQFGIVSGPATLSGDTLTLLGAGEVTIVSLQSGDQNWESAASLEQTLVVQKARQTIQFNPPREVMLGTGLVTLNATSDSGLPVRYLVLAGPATLNGNVLTPVGAGDVRIRAFHSGDANFEEAFNEQTITLKQLTPPVLQLVAESDTLFLKWPAGDTNFVIEAALVFGPGSWAPVTNVVPVLPLNGFWTVRVDAVGSAAFYRLRSRQP